MENRENIEQELHFSVLWEAVGQSGKALDLGGRESQAVVLKRSSLYVTLENILSPLRAPFSSPVIK